MSSLPAVPTPERSPLTRWAEGWLLPFLASILRDTSALTPLVAPEFPQVLAEARTSPARSFAAAGPRLAPPRPVSGLAEGQNQQGTCGRVRGSQGHKKSYDLLTETGVLRGAEPSLCPGPETRGWWGESWSEFKARSGSHFWGGRGGTTQSSDSEFIVLCPLAQFGCPAR